MLHVLILICEKCSLVKCVLYCCFCLLPSRKDYLKEIWLSFPQCSVFPRRKGFEIALLSKSGTLLKTSVQFSCSDMSDSLRPHGLQHARLSCPSSTPEAYSNSCPLSQWCHPTILSSVIPFTCLQSFPESVFLMSWLFASSGKSIGASGSVLLMNIQDRLPLGLTGLISLQSKGLSRAFSNTTV